jgi:uncharacterized protein YecE (DUF72 family)
VDTLPLFDQPAPPGRAKLAEKLEALARQNVWIGTSSWKYEGWLGQIYTAERYLVRGRFSQRKFQDTCLAEYAETFPIVCGDFSFYQFPSEQYWQKLFSLAPPTLRFAFKVPEEITVKTFPKHDRYGARAGIENESFLNAELLRQAFLDPLQRYARQVSVLIFEFGTFSRKSYERAEQFITDLDKFLAALPPEFRYSVEIRNPGILVPEYFDCLRAHGVAHVFNAWTRMPELKSQIAVPGAFTTDFSVTRALLRYGRPYERAVKKFTPYDKVQEVNAGAREAMKAMVNRARSTRQTAFIFVNNRLEGNAPGTIEAVLED